MALARMEKALEAFGRGEFVIVMDSVDHEDECEVIIAAEHCTEAQMAFMIKHSTGIVCLTTTKERLESFGLHPATANNTDKNGPHFYVSTDFIPGRTTGVSAKDRVATLKAFCDTHNPPESFSKPGHMFPLCANPDGVLARGGHTESTFDFCRLAPGIKHPVGALAELMHDDGTMYKDGDTRVFAEKHGIHMVYVTDIKEYRTAHAHWLVAGARKESNSLETKPVNIDTDCSVPSDLCPPPPPPPPFSTTGPAAESLINVADINGPCRIIVHSGNVGCETVLVVKGDVKGKTDVPVRLHSECFTGDTLNSLMCDCGDQLSLFMKLLDEQPYGVLVYVKGHEGRGIGLYHKIQAYKLQRNESLDTVQANEKLGFEADIREWDEVIDALKALEIKSMALYSNNPDKLSILKPHFTVTMKPLPSRPNRYNMRYLETKKIKMAHRTIMETFALPVPEKSNSIAGCKVVVISTKWNAGFVKPVLDACRAELKTLGVATIVETEVPGHMELLAGTRAALRKHKPNVIICVGIIFPGESGTAVHQYNAVTTSLHALTGSQDVPIIQGVIFCENEVQAQERSSGPKNPGKIYAQSALNMVEVCGEN